MEAVVQGPRFSTRGNVFQRAKNFFTNVFKRRKTKSKVSVDEKVVEETNARIISVDETISLLSEIFSLESIVETYEERVKNTSANIDAIKLKISNSDANEKEELEKKLQNLIENLEVDSYILKTKKEELTEKQNKEREVEKEKQPSTPAKEKNPTEGTNPKPQKENNNEYTRLYNRIKILFEDKVKLSTARVERLNNLTNYIEKINSDTSDFQGKLMYIIRFNEAFRVNVNEESSVDNELNANISNICAKNPNFNINEEFGDITKKVSHVSEELIRKQVVAILDKQHLLEKTMNEVHPATQEVIKDILKELDTSLINLNYNVTNPNLLQKIVNEVNKEIEAKYSVSETKPQNEEPKEPSKDTTTTEPKTETVEEKKENTPREKVKPIKISEKDNKKNERKDNLLNELKRQYDKINSINDIVSNPLNMTYDASIYFEEIASKSHKKIKQIMNDLEGMENVSKEELKSQEIFPGSLETFIKLHKEKILRANHELISLQALGEEDEKTLKRIITIKKYLDAERELVERRLVFEKKKDHNLNILGYLSEINEEVPNNVQKPNTEIKVVEPTPKKEEPTTEPSEPEIETRKLNVNEPQRIKRIKALITTWPVYEVYESKKAIKIKINKQARKELRKLLGEIKIIINNNKGLNGVKVTTTETKKGNEVQEITNLDKLKDLKIVIATNGQEIESEEVVKEGRSL